MGKITCKECKCRNFIHGSCDADVCEHEHTYYFCECKCCVASHNRARMHDRDFGDLPSRPLSGGE